MAIRIIHTIGTSLMGTSLDQKKIRDVAGRGIKCRYNVDRTRAGLPETFPEVRLEFAYDALGRLETRTLGWSTGSCYAFKRQIANTFDYLGRLTALVAGTGTSGPGSYGFKSDDHNYSSGDPGKSPVNSQTTQAGPITLNQ